MKAYSQDLRLRILQTVDEGKTQAQAACLFKVSETTVKRYIRQRREKGHVQPKSIPGRPPSKRAPLEAQLQPQLESRPDATLQEHCEAWEAQSGIKVSISTMSRAIEHLEWTRKKKSSKQVREKKRNEGNGENKQRSLMRVNSSF
jgi:transposase